MGVLRGDSCGVVVYHPQRDISMAVHGDDFTALGNSDGLDKFERGMTETFECKLKGRMIKKKCGCSTALCG